MWLCFKVFRSRRKPASSGNVCILWFFITENFTDLCAFMSKLILCALKSSFLLKPLSTCFPLRKRPFKSDNVFLLLLSLSSFHSSPNRSKSRQTRFQKEGVSDKLWCIFLHVQERAREDTGGRKDEMRRRSSGGRSGRVCVASIGRVMKLSF